MACTICTSPASGSACSLTRTNRRAGAVRTALFVERVEPQDGGVFVIEWDAYGAGLGGREARVAAPPVLVIAVSWQELPLQLPTANNRVTVRLPNATA